MCGIVGIMEFRGGADNAPLIKKMCAALAHRGPDSEGLYEHSPVALGHRRLAVVDLTPAGQQPMSTPDGRYTIVFNGEIYNFQHLARTHLTDVSLTSHSDTEVLLHLVARHGEAALPLLRGMFAFAFWDNVRQELLVARDPFGKKPLYYYADAQRFCFASEVKALFMHPDIPREPDRGALAQYFMYEYVPAPATGFRGIQQLPMGHYLKVRDGHVTTTRWWTPTLVPKHAIPEQDALTTLDGLLKQAVTRRLIADVPLGLLLSGGLDSSTLLWYMRQEIAAPFHTFSVSFSEHSFDESAYARAVAARYHTEHHNVPFTLETFFTTLEAVSSRMDVPLADVSLLPTYEVSRVAREHITVALDGDGSDELLAGYGTFTAAAWAERLPSLPALYRVLSSWAQLLPTQHTYFSADFKIKSFLKGLGYPLSQRNQLWLGSFTDRELPLVLTKHYAAAAQAFAPLALLDSELKGLETLDQVSRLTIEHYLQNDILVKLDRASMLHGLEARTPFLDLDVAEFVLRLPVHYKRNKFLLKKLMRGRLPVSSVDRPKQGFTVPLGQWLKGPLAPFMRHVLKPAHLRADGVLDPAYVAHLMAVHVAGTADHRKALWTLLTFQLWYNQWIVGRPNAVATYRA